VSERSEPAPSTIESAAPFRRRTLIALIIVGAVSLIVALVLALFAEDFGEPDTADPNGYSPSAIGFEGLVEVLRAIDVPASTSRSSSAARARDGLLVIAAPELHDDQARAKLAEMAHEARRVLLVLPRWWGPSRDDRPEWIEERNERSADEVAEVLAALEVEASIVREAARFEVPAEWGAAPEVPVAQLVVSDDLDVEIGASASNHYLLGSTWFDDDTKLYVLADPSVIDNDGLRTPANAYFAVALIDDLRAGGPVVFDETLHGFEETPSLQRALTRFPLVLVSIQVLICALLLLWAAAGRWGPARAVAAGLPSGKDFLIRNTAALLHAGGHDGDALRRYLATTIQAVRGVLHAPRELDATALRTWLERLRSARGGTIALPDLEREVDEAASARRGRGDPRKVAHAAARIHRWRTEMTHGPHDHS